MFFFSGEKPEAEVFIWSQCNLNGKQFSDLICDCTLLHVGTASVYVFLVALLVSSHLKIKHCEFKDSYNKTFQI